MCCLNSCCSYTKSGTITLDIIDFKIAILDFVSTMGFRVLQTRLVVYMPIKDLPRRLGRSLG